MDKQRSQLESERFANIQAARETLAQWLRPSMFWTAEREAPSAWTEHVPFAFWLVDVLRPRTIVELGTHHGVSYSAFCQAVKSLGFACACFAVDTWKGDEHSGLYSDEVYDELAAFHDRRYGAFSRLIRSTFDEALPYFSEGSIDLLHLDGLHSYEAVRHDYESWQTKLSPNAIVLFHDTNVRERGFGVFRFWSEVSGGRRHFNFIHGHGLGILGPGGNYPKGLQILFAASGDDLLVTAVREEFCLLGRAARLSSHRLAIDQALTKHVDESKNLRKDLRVSQDEVTAINQALADREARLAMLQDAVVDQTAAVRSLRDALSGRDEEVCVLKDQLAELVDQSVAMKAQLAAREQELAIIGARLSEYEINTTTFERARAAGKVRITAPLRSLNSLLERLSSHEIRYLLIGLLRSVKRGSLGPWREVSTVRDIRRSGLFDEAWYLEKYPDVVNAGVDPVHHYISFGGREGRDPSPHFNTLGYMTLNLDVAAAGLNPLVHYIRHGAKEGRPRPSAVDQRPSVEPSNHFLSVLYVSGTPDLPSHVYRVEHQISALNEIGVTAGWVSVADICRHENLMVFADIVVLFRVSWSSELSKIIEKCRRAGVTILFDIDDYIFDLEIAVQQNVDGIRFIPPEHRKQYREGVIGYRKTLENADAAIFTTNALANAARVMGKPAHVLPNGFDVTTAIRAEKLLAKKSVREKGVVRIGYASGTLTHQKDFAVVAPALVRVLHENANAVLTIVGHLLLHEFPLLAAFRERIELRPGVPLADVVAEMARFDINLAPLEVGNPFCEAKSPLKYFEAALVVVPTVASATEPYRTAIQDGVTGYLAANEDEWYEAIVKLVHNPRARKDVGQRARAESLSVFGPQSKAAAVQKLFAPILDNRVERVASLGPSARQRVLIVLPSMRRGSGGHAKAISLAKGLAERGYSVVIDFLGGAPQYASPQEIEEEFGLNGQSVSAIFTEKIPCDADIVIATFWATVFAIERSGHRFGRKYHFVQDYEPLFYPMGSEHLQAKVALKRDFKKIAYGPWLPRVLSTSLGIDARCIPFYIDKNIYHQRRERRLRHMLVMLARPEMPRRCFDMAANALRRYFETSGRRDRIVFFGSKTIDPSSLPFPCESAGVLTPQELASLYSRGTLGIAFSSTNPSMVPFEMMACGMPVLDLDLEGIEEIYGSRENVFLSPADPDLISNQIAAIMADHVGRQAAANNGRKFVELLPDESEAIDVLAKYLEQDANIQR